MIQHKAALGLSSFPIQGDFLFENCLILIGKAGDTPLINKIVQ